jgi:hypothetical protein
MVGRDLLPMRRKECHPIKVRAITISDEVAASLDYESKLNRDRGSSGCLGNMVKTAREAPD